MTVIAHFGDLHLGLTQLNWRTETRQNQREADFERAAEACFDHLIQQARPDLVVCSGDVFHKIHVSTAAEVGAARLFRRLIDAGIQVVVIGGNHDQPLTHTGRISLHHLAEHGVRVYLTQDQLDVAGVRLHLVPWQALARHYHGIDELRPFDFDPDLTNVLVAHGYAPGDGVTYPPEPVEIPGDWLDDGRFAACLLGHVHISREIRPNVFYGGIIERCDIDEIKVEPAFYLHHFDEHGRRESELVKVADLGVAGVPRPMLRAKIDCAGKTLEEVAREVEPIIESDGSGDHPPVGGALLHLRLLNISADFNGSTLRRQWERMFRKAGGFHIEIRSQTRRVVELMDVKFAAPPVNVADAFEKFMAEQPFADDVRRELITLGQQALADARERIAAREERA
jgi:predicted phosphohydrolase